MGKIPTTRAAGPAAAPGLEPALRHLLAPLVRLLIRQGVPYTAFAAMLKEVYFDVATRELPEGDRETTSRISLVTGLHRKDVRRMREGADERPVVTRETSVASEVFTRWIADPRFLDRRHRPRVLPRLPQGRRGPSFESLANAVSKDVRPRAILDELLRLGLATVDANDRVSLNLDAFAPQRGTEELLYFFGENLHDHLAAAVHNLRDRDRSFLEQAIFGNDMSEASAVEIAKLVKREWNRSVRRIVPRAVALDKADARAGRSGHRMRFGIYFYSEPSRKRHKT